MNEMTNNSWLYASAATVAIFFTWILPLTVYLHNEFFVGRSHARFNQTAAIAITIVTDVLILILYFR